MRVLFVYPNLYTQMGFNHGLASLSAVLKSAGHEVELLNLNEKLPPVPSRDDVYTFVRDWRPGLIGFSCLTMQYEEALAIASLLRERAAADGLVLPPLVVGGIHPTMVPEEVMAHGVWDHVGMGECEDALLALVEATERGGAPDDLANFISWKGGQRPDAIPLEHEALERLWQRNQVGAFPDFAEMPEPDYELFDTARITEQKHGWFGLMSSRGCPYRCTYCLNHKIVDLYKEDHQKSVSNLGFFRYRPADKMIAEIEGVLERYPMVGTFILDDDLFTMNPEHAIAFCDAYSAAGIKVPFVVNSHVKRLDPRVAEALARAGCKILKLGIESGSPRVRSAVLKRFMSQDDMLATAATADEHGLHTSGFVMIGLPTETRAERWETVDLLAQSAIGRFRTSFFYPFPGTEGYDLAVQAGYEPSDAKTREASSFTEGSVINFGAAENLLIDKLGTVMPWLVNARLDRYRAALAAARYRPLTDEVLGMDRAAWERFKPGVRERDAELSHLAARAGELHYSIRYNAFMGVRSDYFLAEESGIEWATAAAKPEGERLQSLALAAAASESC